MINLPFEMYVRDVNGALCWVGEGRKGRHRAGELRGGPNPIVMPCRTKEDARIAQDLLLGRTNVIPGQRPSVRRWDDPIIQAFIGFMRACRERGFSVRDAQDHNAPLSYSIESFFRTARLRIIARTSPKRTGDPLIDTLRLTDVDRDQDYVSRVMRGYLHHYRDDPLNVRVANLMFHRALSCVDDINVFGWVRDRGEAHAAVERLWANERRPKGPPWGTFGNVSNGVLPWSRERWHQRVDSWSSSKILNCVTASTTSDDVQRMIAKFHWPGLTNYNNFTLFQVVLDLGWLLPALDQGQREIEQQWALFRVRRPSNGVTTPNHCRGSGTTMLLMMGEDPYVYGDGKGLTQSRVVTLEFARRLCALQYDHGFNGELTVPMIEHWACEFNKIMRVYEGVTPARQLYRPRALDA